MEFIRGQKLTSLPKHEIRELVDVGQTAFLVQLLDVGYLHAGQCCNLTYKTCKLQR